MGPSSNGANPHFGEIYSYFLLCFRERKWMEIFPNVLQTANKLDRCLTIPYSLKKKNVDFRCTVKLVIKKNMWSILKMHLVLASISYWIQNWCWQQTTFLLCMRMPICITYMCASVSADYCFFKIPCFVKMFTTCSNIDLVGWVWANFSQIQGKLMEN